MTMRCIWVAAVGGFSVAEVPVPPLRPGEVRVHVEVAGLCRTDLKLIRVGHRDLVLPRIPGEEVVGVVDAIGPDVGDLAPFGPSDVLTPGRRVYVYPGVWCDDCPACRMGAQNLCRNMRIMGFHRDGGMAEYVTVPARSLLPVPEAVSAAHAVFAEPLSCCLNALELGAIRPGMSVAIWGAGPAGMLLHRAAAALGAHPCNIELDERRRARAGGRATAPEAPVDLAVVAVGARQAYLEAMDSLGPRGRLVFFSGLAPTESNLGFDVNRMHYLEQSTVGAYGCCLRHGRQALDWIATGRIQVADLISHTLPLHELDRALQLVANREGMKIHLRP